MRRWRLAPDGVDIYFVNVGGDHLEAAIGALRTYGRIVACGSISRYNDAEPTPGPRNMFMVVTKRLRLQGYIITDHGDRFGEFERQATEWVRDGRLRYRETIVEGTRTRQRVSGSPRGTTSGRCRGRRADRVTLRCRIFGHKLLVAAFVLPHRAVPALRALRQVVRLPNRGEAAHAHTEQRLWCDQVARLTGVGLGATAHCAAVSV